MDVMEKKATLPHLSRVVLVQLCLSPVSPPQAQHFGLGRVRHVHQTLEEPALDNCSRDGPQYQSVVPHLHEPQRTGAIDPLVYGEALSVQQPRAQWLQVNVISILNWTDKIQWLLG